MVTFPVRVRDQPIAVTQASGNYGSLEYQRLIDNDGSDFPACPSGAVWRIIAIKVVCDVNAIPNLISLQRRFGHRTQIIWYLSWPGLFLTCSPGVDTTTNGNFTTSPTPNIEMQEGDVVHIDTNTLNNAQLVVAERMIR